ncbi:DNA-binding response regulator [Bacteroidia bacterium]|nr:DNA-binding response regulator [Bacteroidia bacterium]
MNMKNNSQLIQVWIVDDHKILVDGLSRIINDSGSANVSAVYYNLDSCRKGLIAFRPDVLLLDVELPDGNGVDFCAEIIALYPDLKIMMLTSFYDVSIAKRSLLNGTRGYILKNAMPEELIEGIQEVNNGEPFLCEDIEVLLQKYKKEKIIRLTSREKDVLQLIADGLSNIEIAGRLGIGLFTVKDYRKNMMLKFDVNNSMTMVKFAMEQKLI